MPKPSPRDLLKREFSNRLSKILADRSWSQADLARAAEKHLPKGEEFRRDNVNVYVRGLALPRPKQLNAIAKALGMTAEDLLPGGAREGASLPYSMRPVDGDAGHAWLQVDMKVPMRKALAVLAMLDES